MSQQERIISFKWDNHPSIVAASKLIIDYGMRPHRVVLRREGDGKYITHMENMVLEGDTWKHCDFYWGHYFEQADARDKAMKDFAERSLKL